MIAVLGAGGQLGSAFCRLLGAAAHPVTRAELDLTDLAAIQPWMEARRPEVVVNCAAYTAVDAAEEDEATARRVNADAVGVLAEAARDSGARLVTFSTDYVFDGTKPEPYVESDPPHPMSAYGRTKAEGERLALEANPEALVVRTSWVLSGTHPNFAATMLRLIRQGPVQVVNDQRGRPTIVDDLAPATLACVEAGAYGIVHLTNQGETTWYGLACEIAQIAGLDPDRVSPCTTEEFPRPAPRPANSVLDSERLEGLGVAALPHYRPSLERVVADLVARGF
ncbi:MAG: dTDP-4-dehydrorhamnose reductase [Acidimicrobiia bacterium]